MKDMYVKLIKKWGGYSEGDVIRFGWNKGQGRVDAGEGVVVKKQACVNPKPGEKKPVIETAMHKPDAETAMLDNKPDENAKADARAEAENDSKDIGAKPLTEGKSRSRFSKRK